MNPHQPAAAGPREMVASFWRNRQLLGQLTRREVLGRYRGSLMGLAWSFFNPLLMLAVYTFVFSVVFNARWGTGEPTSRVQFALVLFVGVIVHGVISEGINKAPGLILGNASYVKRVIFPLEILPWVVVGSAVFHAAISLAILLLAQLLFDGGIPATALWLPLVLLPIVPMTMGLTWLLAATGVFIRDIAQLTGIITTVLMFMAPVFYPISALPEQYRKWLYLNPVTYIIEQARAVLFSGLPPDWTGLALYSAIALLVAGGGFWWFQMTRKGFADVV
ncbi:MAG TPA: ABC transporter permease [Luteimonas sp.]|jgi:lipopolysaccharide transport system permease protein|nr:ABC transporter permease [Luteimonas sp.]